MKAGSCISLILILCFRGAIALPDYQDKSKDTQVLKLIRMLPEVRSFLRIANKSEWPNVIIDNTPDAENGYKYRVKVGYSKNMFRSVLIFEVDAKTMKIYYEDWGAEYSPANITLKAWRRFRKDPRFDQFHTFKNNQIVALDKNGKVIK